jgi:hypothetical protein
VRLPSGVLREILLGPFTGADPDERSHLTAALTRHTSTRRILLPAQEWGSPELACVRAQLLTFAPMGDPSRGVWVAERARDATAHYERGVLLAPQPGIQRRRSAGAHADLRTYYSSNPEDFTRG